MNYPVNPMNKKFFFIHRIDRKSDQPSGQSGLKIGSIRIRSNFGWMTGWPDWPDSEHTSRREWVPLCLFLCWWTGVGRFCVDGLASVVSWVVCANCLSCIFVDVDSLSSTLSKHFIIVFWNFGWREFGNCNVLFRDFVSMICWGDVVDQSNHMLYIRTCRNHFVCLF